MGVLIACGSLSSARKCHTYQLGMCWVSKLCFVDLPLFAPIQHTMHCFAQGIQRCKKKPQSQNAYLYNALAVMAAGLGRMQVRVAIR